jgi:hypothetical protein
MGRRAEGRDESAGGGGRDAVADEGTARHLLHQRPAESYATTIKRTYRDAEPSRVNPSWRILKPTEGMALTQAVKHRNGRHLDRVEVRVVFGEEAALPYAVHLERLNGVLRDRLNCLTRQTHGFAKETENWDALVSLAIFEQNWLHPHIALRAPLGRTARSASLRSTHPQWRCV